MRRAGRAVLVALGAAVLLGAANAPLGERIVVRPQDLPAPKAGDSARNPPEIIDRPEGVLPQVPPGFSVTLFAQGLKHARWLTAGQAGDVFLAESNAGRVTILRDRDGDGRADTVATFADGFQKPHGLEVRGAWLYVADTEAVWRLPYRPGTDRPGGERQRVTPPGALGSGSGHSTRGVAIHPDGERFYVAIGSGGNLGVEPSPRATVQEFRSDGSGQRTFASGLRNPVGMAFLPGTARLFAVVNERDGMGDDLVPDYLTEVRDGGFYGWPYAYIGPHPQPGFAERRPDLVAATLTPELLFLAHSAPLGLTFAAASAFPAEYRSDAFVALHGSWNAAQPRGYMVARVPFRNGRPEGGYLPFVTGFWHEGGERAKVWGRPVGLAIANDGSLLIADDVGQVVWRVAAAR